MMKLPNLGAPRLCCKDELPPPEKKTPQMFPKLFQIVALPTVAFQVYLPPKQGKKRSRVAGGSARRSCCWPACFRLLLLLLIARDSRLGLKLWKPSAAVELCVRASEAPPGFPTRAERARERERKVAQRREVLSKHPLVYGVVTAKPQRGSCNEGVLCGGMLLVF